MQQVAQNFLGSLPAILQLRWKGLCLPLGAVTLSQTFNQFFIRHILVGSEVPKQLRSGFVLRTTQEVDHVRGSPLVVA